jgi:RES domain-containing protein
MVVYRITLTEFAGTLFASGNPARWNSADLKVIYTAATRALACLENVVHRSSLGLKENFRTNLIEIPDDLKMDEIAASSLEAGWREYAHYPYTQKFGDQWIKANLAAVLKVPSAIIPEESNYLLNPLHKEFRRIRYLGNEPFDFDERIKPA